MKLLIQTELAHELTATKYVAVQYRYFKAEIILCKRFGVHYSIESKGNQTKFKITPQKITLDSVNVNELLSDVFHLFAYTMEYAALGGAGCDLALRINANADFDFTE